MRSPKELSSGGCGYCVRVTERHKSRALEQLKAAGLAPLRVYRVEPDGYTEVTA